MKNCAKNSKVPLVITLLTIVFLYLPLVMVLLMSFNASKYGGNWTEFSLKWYKELFSKRDIWEALYNTLLIAAISTLFSTILGTAAAIAINRSRGKFKALYYGLVQTPLVVPDILQGISLLLLFITIFSLVEIICPDCLPIKLELGLTTIIIAHITFSVSYVTMVVLERLYEFDKSLIEAAQDLGASAKYTFFHVTLPTIFPGILAGALFAFMLSIDDFVITFFVKGAGDTTLPLLIEAKMRRGSPAIINALSVIFLVVTFILVYFAQKLMSPKKENQK